jgi:putative flippase GtrA
MQRFLNRIASRQEATTFFRFCLIGTVGFVSDGGVLLLLTRGLSLGPLVARAISFPVAVLVTFTLNRIWTFKTGVKISLIRALALFYSVQGTGFLLNLMIYAAAVLMLPFPLNLPIAALAIASAVALVVNYSGSRLLVFPAAKHR